MSSFLFENLSEHHKYPGGEPLPAGVAAASLYSEILFQNQPEKKCVEIRADNTLHTSYYVGVDWISNEKTVYVAPKLNTKNVGSFSQVGALGSRETDFIGMLFHCLKYHGTTTAFDELFEIKWNEPKIEIEQQRDLLTPLLVVEFLGLVERIVRKGLKKSYYPIERNMNARVKGKVLVARTLKENIFQNKNLKTICVSEEFGINCVENRLLKLTLGFIRAYLPVFAIFRTEARIEKLFSYVMPAFEKVSEDVDLKDIKYTKSNPFYKEYTQAIKLGRLILERYGYNISNVGMETIKTPPFWIDMSKLFELYVLGLLKAQFKDQVIYHPTYNKKELDFLLLSPPIVIDAKYKPRYVNDAVLADARQLSGYARMHKVYDALKYSKDRIIDCLIIYPDQECNVTDLSRFDSLIKESTSVIPEYVNFYKIGIQLPVVKTNPFPTGIR